VSISFADRLAAEVKPIPCKMCQAIVDLTDDEWDQFKEARPDLSIAGMARVLLVGETTAKRHVLKAHVDPR
jgi:hypothetical protein